MFSPSPPSLGKNNPFSDEQLAAHPDGRIDFSGLWRDGKLLVIDPTYPFLPFCVKTNLPADDEANQPFALGHFKWVAVRYGLNSEWTRQWRMRKVALQLLGLCALLLTFALIALQGMLLEPEQLEPPWFAYRALAVGGTLGIVALALWIANFPLSLAKSTTTHLWLRGVHPGYLARLPEWQKR